MNSSYRFTLLIFACWLLAPAMAIPLLKQFKPRVDSTFVLAADEEYKRVKIMVRAFPGNTDPEGTEITEVKFQIKTPDGEELEWRTANALKKNKFRIQNRFRTLGTWQWRVEVTSSIGDVKTAMWRDIHIVDSIATDAPTTVVPIVSSTPSASPVDPSPTVSPTATPSASPVDPSPTVSPTATTTTTPSDPPTKTPTVSPTKIPTRLPTTSPTATPTKAPFPNPPTASPTATPTKAPVPIPPIPISTTIEEVSDEIRELLDDDSDLGAKFVRLGFHMCVGGCDGCVNMNNVDNKGLEVPINAIASIVSTYTSDSGLSRADIWALAALIAAEEAQDNNNGAQFVDFPFEWYGRTDCSQGAFSGPDQDFPPPDLSTHQLLEFFSTNFGLSTRETVALMGAHTLGELSRMNSGFDGPRGWNNNRRSLDNGFYDGLIGGDENDNRFDGQNLPDFDTLIRARDWDLVEENNNDIPDIPNRFVWENRRGGGGGGRRTLMTNADMALVRDFSEHINDSTGEVSCSFRGSNGGTRCPHAEATFYIAAEYKYDVQTWIEDFSDVFTKVLLQGYDTSSSCVNPPCQL